MARRQHIHWSAVEDEIFAEGASQFPEIAKLLPDDQFYGVFFDCDIQQQVVYGHLNTETYLREYSENLKSKDKGPRPLYASLTVEQLMEDMRWDGGSWRQNAVFAVELDDLESVYQQLYDRIGIKADEELQEDFMLTVCRAALRLDRSGAFDEFKRRCDFRILCVHIDETVDDGDARLQRIRKSL